MKTAASYDDVADWYEREFLTAQRAENGTPYADRLGIDQAIVELLGPGSGICLEVGCGTGIYGPKIAELGRRPVGVDISAGMLAHTRGRLAAVRGDAYRLPFADGSVDTVIAIMVHTDMPDYPATLREIHRVLSAGGTFVHIGVHPCFCGGFADRGDPEAVVIRPGYLDGHWTTDSWTDRGLRDKVGASHFPLASLVNSVVGTGFAIERMTEGAEPTPIVLSFRARRP